EGELHRELNLAAEAPGNRGLWDRRQQPLAFQHPERAADQVHHHPAVLLQRVARGELAPQRPTLYPDRCDDLAVRFREYLGVGAPGPESGTTPRVVGTLEQPGRVAAKRAPNVYFHPGRVFSKPPGGLSSAQKWAAPPANETIWPSRRKHSASSPKTARRAS